MENYINEIKNVNLHLAEPENFEKICFLKKKKKKKVSLNFLYIFIIFIILLFLFSKPYFKINQLNPKSTEQNKNTIKEERNIIKANKNKTQELKNQKNTNHIFNQENKSFINKDKWKNETLVIHAIGKYNNKIYANSFEGLNYYYIIKKMTLMEADFLLTKDKHVVLAHDYKNYKKVPNFEEFKIYKLKGNLTAMIFEDLVKFMFKNKDLYIITDTKYIDLMRIEREFNEITEILNKYGDVNERFIIEIYNEKMYEFLKKKNYPFNHFLFTLYKRLKYPYNYNDMEKIFIYCKEKKIDGIIMWAGWFNDKISNFSKKYSVPVYLHTINDIQRTVKLINQGAKAIFTDNLTNELLKKFLK